MKQVEISWTIKCKILVAQSCPTLRNPVDYSPPGSSVQGFLQEGIQERVAIPFFRESSGPRDEPMSPALQADSLPSEPPRKPLMNYIYCEASRSKAIAGSLDQE